MGVVIACSIKKAQPARAGALASGTFTSDLPPGLIVLATGDSIAPPLLLLTILFLGSRGPLPNATALGYFTTCAVMGIAGLTLFGGAEVASSIIGRVISVSVVCSSYWASGASCTLPTLTRSHPDGWSR